jgi:hypothetical protein
MVLSMMFSKRARHPYLKLALFTLPAPAGPDINAHFALLLSPASDDLSACKYASPESRRSDWLCFCCEGGGGN